MLKRMLLVLVILTMFDHSAQAFRFTDPNEGMFEVAWCSPLNSQVFMYQYNYPVIGKSPDFITYGMGDGLEQDVKKFVRDAFNRELYQISYTLYKGRVSHFIVIASGSRMDDGYEFFTNLYGNPVITKHRSYDTSYHWQTDKIHINVENEGGTIRLTIVSKEAMEGYY